MAILMIKQSHKICQYEEIIGRALSLVMGILSISKITGKFVAIIIIIKCIIKSL